MARLWPRRERSQFHVFCGPFLTHPFYHSSFLKDSFPLNLQPIPYSLPLSNWPESAARHQNTVQEPIMSYTVMLYYNKTCLYAVGEKIGSLSLEWASSQDFGRHKLQKLRVAVRIRAPRGSESSRRVSDADGMRDNGDVRWRDGTKQRCAVALYCRAGTAPSLGSRDPCLSLETEIKGRGSILIPVTLEAL